MDTERLIPEKQPKTCVLVIAEKFHRNNKFLLIQTRQKEPYFGFRGFISGKMRFGETLFDTAKRELLEETGLSAEFKLKYTLHEHVYSQNKELLEDKFFYVIEASNTKGKVINTKEGKNNWIKRSEVKKLDKLFYDVTDILKWFNSSKRKFIEKKYYVEKF